MAIDCIQSGGSQRDGTVVVNPGESFPCLGARVVNQAFENPGPLKRRYATRRPGTPIRPP